MKEELINLCEKVNYKLKEILELKKEMLILSEKYGNDNIEQLFINDVDKLKILSEEYSQLIKEIDF